MKKFWIQIILLLLVIFGALMLYTNQGLLPGLLGSTTSNKTLTKLQIKDTTIDIELADTAAKRQQGLGDRDNLASNSGMLFIFPETDKYRFWMKGMRFPLDFIWIKDEQIVDLLANIPSPTAGQADDSLPVYEPNSAINKVIEVNAGFIAAHNIQIGDTVTTVSLETSKPKF